MGDLASNVDMGPMSRDSAGAAPVDIEAPEGLGGVADASGVEVGVDRRRASVAAEILVLAAFAAGLESARGFSKSEYARRHPAGELGKKSREPS